MFQGIPENDISRFIETARRNYHYDFSHYASVSFRSRLKKVMDSLRIQHMDDLLLRLEENEAYFDVFLKHFSVDDTELFRDPTMWCELRDSAIPCLFHHFDQLHCWFPEISSGEELFSLLILLKENFPGKIVRITCSCNSIQSLNSVKKGVFSQKKADVSNVNYQHYNPGNSFEKYYRKFDRYIQADLELLNAVIFQHARLFHDRPPKGINFIMFRNALIYFDRQLKQEALAAFYDLLPNHGLLVIGDKERLSSTSAGAQFDAFSKTERIFIKKS